MQQERRKTCHPCGFQYSHEGVLLLRVVLCPTCIHHQTDVVTGHELVGHGPVRRLHFFASGYGSRAHGHQPVLVNGRGFGQQDVVESLGEVNRVVGKVWDGHVA